MHILIIDDEPLARSRLRHLLGACAAPGHRWLLSEAANASQAMQLLAGQPPVQVVLLDIQMPGANGMSLAFTLQQLPLPPAIIFVTAHSQYAAQAFDVQACDYLTKPVRLERLQQALAKAQKMLAPVAATPAPAPVLAQTAPGRSLPIALAQIVCVKAELKMLTVHTLTGCHVLEGSLLDLEQRHPQQLLRVHRSMLVNPAFIRGLERHEDDGIGIGIGDGWYLRLQGLAQPAPVSRRQLPAVRAALKVLGNQEVEGLSPGG